MKMARFFRLKKIKSIFIAKSNIILKKLKKKKMFFNLIRRPSSGSYQINHFLSKITESLKNKNQITIVEVPVVANRNFLNQI